MTATFVPWSKSRNKDAKPPSLNWHVTILRNGRAVLDTDYSAGMGNCPAYKLSVKLVGHQNSLMRDGYIRFECENGYATRDGLTRWGKPLMPELRDVLYSLAADANVLNSSTYEDWASEYGYDPDSRKGEAIYRACLEIALKLRNALGEDGLAKLQAACQDY